MHTREVTRYIYGTTKNDIQAICHRYHFQYSLCIHRSRCDVHFSRMLWKRWKGVGLVVGSNEWQERVTRSAWLWRWTPSSTCLGFFKMNASSTLSTRENPPWMADSQRSGHLFQQFQDDTFFAFSRSGIQDGSDGLHILALFPDDFTHIRFFYR